jgi:hypothetical protein
MIVRNEEAFLNASLSSVKAILGLDDMVVVDTGSTDKTIEIAADNGAEVFDFKWIDDFSAARNFSASKAKHDWILYLDADEEIKDADIDALSLFIVNADDSSAGAIKMIAHPDNTSSNTTRLYNRKHHKLEGTIHEQIVPVHDNGKVITAIPIVAVHYGYAPDVKKSKGKFERNARMLKDALEKQPDDPYILAQLGKCYYVNGEDLHAACGYFEQALAAGEDYRLEYVYVTVEFYGYSLLNTKQYEKALGHVNKYASFYTADKPEFRFLMAHVYQNNGLLQEAVELYESCIGANMIDTEGITSYLSYYNIGVILECVGMIEDAVAIYAKCGNYEPAKSRLTHLRSLL